MKRKIKMYISSEKLRRVDFIIFLMAALLAVLSLFFRMPFSEVLSTESDISLAYEAKQGADGSIYVVDSGHTRLICFDESGSLRFIIDDIADEEGSLSYIDDFIVTEGGKGISDGYKKQKV